MSIDGFGSETILEGADEIRLRRNKVCHCYQLLISTLIMHIDMYMPSCQTLILPVS